MFFAGISRKLASALFLCAAVLLAAATPTLAGDCVRRGSVCVDTTPSKNISGLTVTIDQVGGCWRYQDTYECLAPNAVNYCQPLISAGCWQTSSTCAQWDTLFGTGCMRYTQTYRCGDPSLPTPPNTIRLNDTYTLVSSDYDPGPCQSLAANTGCTIAEERCVQTTPDSPLPPGIDPAQVAPDGCYRKEQTYACLTGRTDNDCSRYASNPNCTLQATAPCSAEDTLNGACLYQEQTYRCQTTPPQTTTVTDCSGQAFCQGGNCFDTGYPSDPDFARTMALMEAAREGGVYNQDGVVFSGVDSRCKIKLFGLANCCKTSGGGAGYSNSLLFNLAGQVGGQVLSYGSRYVYDALYTSSAPDWMVKGMAALIGVDPVQVTSALADWSPSLGLFGLTVSTGTIAPGFVSSALGLGVIELGSFGGFTLAFDPGSFALQIGLMILSDLLSCDQSEQLLAMRKGQNLCHEVGTYCSQKLKLLFIKICIEKTKSYCCFNSRLARIINEQGRAQIGKSWGSAESPSCSGFTPAEFAAIDFSRLDLSEFMAEVMANVRMPSAAGIQSNIQGVVQQKMLNYYERGTQ